ncbi:MAG TPA: rhodanese-like domain-containing protein [Candidatus Binatia bacterium]
MSDWISATDLAALMSSDGLYAVFDIRERGEFNESQISFATSLPRSQIEFRIGDLVPAPEIPVIVYGVGDGREQLAATTIENLGYANVSILTGGLSAWKDAHLLVVSGVNVPSKAFGERLQHQENVPEITPQELKALQETSADMVIFDLRTPEEYGRFCIPGAVNVPGGDLILRAGDLRRHRTSNIIVNCAGRTRSIVGAAALRRLGVSNARALKNGTMGWVLAGFELESRPNRKTPEASEQSRDEAHSFASSLQQQENIASITAGGVADLLDRQNQTATYLIDVRSEPEYESAHIEHSINVPGGQAVQRADDFIAVRNAKIVFVSGESSRATMAAYWYRQLGFRDVAVLEGGLRRWRESGFALASGIPAVQPLGVETALQQTRRIAPAEVHELLENSSPLVLDVGSSADYERGHLPAARWISRSWLEIKIPEQFPDRRGEIILSCTDGQNSVFAAQALRSIGYVSASVLDGGVHQWIAGGYPLETGLTNCLIEPNDVVLSPSIKGDKEAMMRYLEWEEKLVTT